MFSTLSKTDILNILNAQGEVSTSFTVYVLGKYQEKFRLCFLSFHLWTKTEQFCFL